MRSDGQNQEMIKNMKMKEIKGAGMEILILIGPETSAAAQSCTSVPDARRLNGETKPQRRSETWMESNCKAPRL